MRILTTCNSSTQAHLVKNTLENHGIFCMIENEYSAKFHMNSGVQVLVKEEDYKKALQILLEQNDAKQRDSNCCPSCGSQNIQFTFGEKKWLKSFAIILSIFSSSPFNNIQSTRSCEDCRWKDR